MKIIVCGLISCVEKNEQKTAQTKSERKDVNEREDFIFPQAADHDLERQDEHRDIHEEESGEAVRKGFEELTPVPEAGLSKPLICGNVAEDFFQISESCENFAVREHPAEDPFCQPGRMGRIRGKIKGPHFENFSLERTGMFFQMEVFNLLTSFKASMAAGNSLYSLFLLPPLSGVGLESRDRK